MFRRLREDIKSIIERDPAARNAWEVLTCYPGISGHSRSQGFALVLESRPEMVRRFFSHLARIATGIEIHPAAVIGRRVFIDHGCGVVIGETAEVGDDCTIYQGVTLGGTSLSKGKKRHPTLERGVIIGAGAKVLGSFTVGEMAKVGSNAVVVKPVPAGATAVGNPARIIQKDESKIKTDAASVLFSSYGITPNEDDPLIKALRGLINNAAAQEHQLKNIISALEAAKIPLETLPEDETVSPEQLNKLVE